MTPDDQPSASGEAGDPGLPSKRTTPRLIAAIALTASRLEILDDVIVAIGIGRVSERGIGIPFAQGSGHLSDLPGRVGTARFGRHNLSRRRVGRKKGDRPNRNDKPQF